MLTRWLQLHTLPFATLLLAAVLIGCPPARSAPLPDAENGETGVISPVSPPETGGGAPETAAPATALPGPVLELAARTEALQTLTARLKLKVEVRGKRYSGIALAAFARPDYFRLDVFHVLGMQFLTLVRDGDTVTLVDYFQQRYLQTTREALPEKFRGWFALWEVFPTPDTAALHAAAWETRDRDCLGTLGPDTGQQYRLTVNAAEPRLDQVAFLIAGEELGTLDLSDHTADTRLPGRFHLTADELIVDGEFLETQANLPLEPVPVVIPAQFQPVQP